VTTKKQSPDITMVVHLVSPDGSLDQLFPAVIYALLQIRDELARLDGGGDGQCFRAREIFDAEIWLDPHQLSAAAALTAQDAVTPFQEQNVQVAAGSSARPPVPKGANGISIQQ